MIHFDLEDRYADENVVGSAISRREGVIFSIVGHSLILALLVFAPTWALFQPSPEELQQQEEELAQQQQQERDRMMVFVQPRVDNPATQAPEMSELSDLDRRAQAPEVSPRPDNPLPFMRGNSAERNEAAEAERARGPESPEPPQPEPPQPEATDARLLPPASEGIVMPREQRPPRPQAGGQLGEALRNLQRYVQNETFDNPQGGQRDPGATIQFDTKGVEFGPWLRRFVSRVRRNWFIPLSAMTMRGHVVLQFNIWKDGRITDISIVQPAALESFNNAAYNAIVSSSPVDPLPPEYPSEKAFFTVTFYYNERPPGQ